MTTLNAAVDGPPSVTDADLCAVEPIHTPGGIQPHGALLVFDRTDLRLLQASANAPSLLGLGMDEIAAALREPLAAAGGAPAGHEVAIAGRAFGLTVHESAQGLLVECEPASRSEGDTFAALYPRIRAFVDQIEASSDLVSLCTIAAAEVRRLTGFNRVLVYRFSPEWHGTVIAEDGDGTLPSYLDLRFPASDIPAQARALYLRSRLRLIPDARYVPVPMQPALSPLDGKPLDMSLASLRSVSPVHLEYMRNMGTDASMSISIIVDAALWGLISCHHTEPRVLGPQLRSACDFIGQILAMQILARERGAHADERLALAEIERELLARVSRAPTIQSGLVENPDAWLHLARATGAAVVMDGAVLTAGQAPSVDQLSALALWLGQQRADGVFATDRLAALYPPATEFAGVASGLLAVSISALYPHFILWFRPEVVRTVRWGGEPAKLRHTDGRLHPRQSFAQWSEELRETAEAWTRAEKETAAAFMTAVVSFVLKRAEERAELTEKLERSNSELEAFSYSVSHDLRAPFRHVVGYAQLLREREAQLDDRSRHYLDAIVDAAGAAGRLVDDLLNFSQLGRSTLDMTPIDMNKLVAEIRQSLEIDARGREVDWQVLPLPRAFGDGALIRQALSNLLDNALKYTRGRQPAVIEISGEERGHETVFVVRDNGVGFDMAYVGKLFGVFQRLQRAEDFEGTGIGLALARRIVDRHGGWIAAEGELNRGATFRLGLPKENYGDH